MIKEYSYDYSNHLIIYRPPLNKLTNSSFSSHSVVTILSRAKKSPQLGPLPVCTPLIYSGK